MIRSLITKSLTLGRFNIRISFGYLATVMYHSICMLITMEGQFVLNISKDSSASNICKVEALINIFQVYHYSLKILFMHAVGWAAV